MHFLFPVFYTFGFNNYNHFFNEMFRIIRSFTIDRSFQ